MICSKYFYNALAICCIYKLSIGITYHEIAKTKVYFPPTFLSTLTFVAIFLIVYCEPSSDEDSILAKYRQKILASHNIYRQIHQAPDLMLSPELNEEAQRWAEKLSRIGYLLPSGTKYGENLLFLPDVTYDELDTINIVARWYEPGVSQYPTGNYSEWAQFTQIIWKSTKWLGVGIASRGEVTYVVCFYEPKGNIEGQFENNVVLDFTSSDPADGIGVVSLWMSALIIVLILSTFVLILIFSYYHWI